MSRIYLDVPFLAKDAAKAKGARWDPEKKSWYISSTMKLELFEQWLKKVDKSKVGASKKTKKRKKQSSRDQKNSQSTNISLTNADVIIVFHGRSYNHKESGIGLVSFVDGEIDEQWYGLYSPDRTSNMAALEGLLQALYLAENYQKLGKTVIIASNNDYAIKKAKQASIKTTFKMRGHGEQPTANYEKLMEIKSFQKSIGEARFEILKKSEYLEIAQNLSAKAIENGDKNGDFARVI